MYDRDTMYSTIPRNEIDRSKFDLSFDYKTTGNVGSLIPFYYEEVLPGDTFQVKDDKVIRLQTPLNPFMDNLYMDTYYFFIPLRLCWEHFKQFMGENTTSAWIPSVTYTKPQCTAPSSGWSKGTIADYLGIPTSVSNFSVDALPFRAYARVVEDWFRDQNLQNPVNLTTGDANTSGSNGTNYITDLEKGGMPFTVCKLPDLFVKSLPSPQKGPDVLIDVTGGGSIPVFGNGKSLAMTDGTNYGISALNNSQGLIIGNGSLDSNVGTSISASVGSNLKSIGVATKTYLDGTTPPTSYSATGLVADITDMTVMTVNQLRQAMQMQKFYEAIARSGSRYIEIIKSLFGVDSPDARLQRTEFLYGHRTPFAVNQVLQTSQTDNTDLGTTGAYSLTVDSNDGFTKSFTEHGIILGLCCARYKHTYQNMLERKWTRKERFDYYFPQFANISEQPIKNSQIYLQGSTVINPNTGKPYDDEVFGYNEAWIEYRTRPNMVTGEMRSNYAQSLDVWHLADDYSAMPTLGSTWILEDVNTVDRVLSVAHTVADQFFMDVHFSAYATRPMPTFSVPGLMDHH